MEVFDDFDKLPTINFIKQHGAKCFSDNRAYFNKKNKIIRMYDSSHIIKSVHGDYAFFEKLSELKIDGVVTPEKIFSQSSYSSDKYYITTKYIADASTLGYLIYQKIPLEQMIRIILKIIQLIKKCHQKNFFIIDICNFNILVTKDDNPYLIDFDTSCFIENDNLIANINSLMSYIYDDFISNFLSKYYFNPDRCFCYTNNEFIPKFIFLDKISLLLIFKDYLYYKLGIDAEELWFDASNLSKVGLPKDMEKKFSQMIEGDALANDDYFEAELHELLGSRFIRKRKFN